METNVPPPPYSETDVMSTSASISPLTPSPSHAEDVSVTALSSATSSVEGSVITPPYTPTSSIHHNQVIGEEASGSSSAGYFSSRPVAFGTNALPEMHQVYITSRTQPKDLPYPASFSSKDITQQDWATFLNHPLPEHSELLNRDVRSRKLHEIASEKALPLEMHQPLSPSILSDPAAVISEWNEGFFIPRGVKTSMTSSPRTEATRTDRAVTGESSTRRDESQRSYFGGLLQTGRDSFRFGPIAADSEGFRIGRHFIADQNGLQIGGSKGFVASDAGLSIRGHHFGPPQGEPSASRGRHQRRGHGHGHEKCRTRSASTSSSASSASSRSHTSSIGSLPDCDDIKPQQLPLARQSLMEWLNHPDQPVTREKIQNFRQEMKAVGKRNSNDRPSDNDFQAMRAEVKELLKKFKEVKKAQKQKRKIARRERHAIRRAAKKARKQERKEERRARKYMKRGCNAQGPPPWAAPQTGLPLPNPGRARVLSRGEEDAEHLRGQAKQLDILAAGKEGNASSLRTLAASGEFGEKERAIKTAQAREQEEEAVQYRLEAVRLRAEALHLDREPVVTGQQASGVISAS